MSELDPRQAAAAAQFDRQSARYGRSHVLADTSDLADAVAGMELPKGARALDIATGGGHAALFFAKRGWEVMAGDIAPRMLDAAQALAAAEGFTIRTGLFSAEALPFDESSFDLVASRVAPHHFSSPARFVTESARVLKPGGWFLLIDGTVPDNDAVTEEWLHRVECWRDPSHNRFLARTAWEALVVASGMKLVRSELKPMKQPDLQWYFETAATSAENRERVLEAIRTAPESVRAALQLGREDDRIVWWWPRLTLLARRRS